MSKITNFSLFSHLVICGCENLVMEISCAFKNQIGTDYKLGCRYVCEVTSAIIVQPNTRVKAYIGVHLLGQTDDDVEAISFSHVLVRFFPRGLHKIFPNLKAVYMKGCGLKQISKKDLSGLENLLTLNIDSNQLKSLPRDLFDNMKKLQHVSFSGSQLARVDSRMLEPILWNDLSLVSFCGNANNYAIFDPSYPLSVSSVQQMISEIDANFTKPIEEDENETSMQSFAKSFLKGFEKLWRSGKFSDFVIIVNGTREFRVHKNVLAIQSSVFAAMFENELNLKNSIEINDFSSEAFEEFLRYIYTGEIPDDTNAMEIFAISGLYEVTELRNVCEEMVLGNLDQTNALEAFSLADRYSANNMRELAFNEIKRMFPEKHLTMGLVKRPESLKSLIDARRKLNRVSGETARMLDLFLKS